MNKAKTAQNLPEILFLLLLGILLLLFNAPAERKGPGIFQSHRGSGDKEKDSPEKPK